MIDLRQITSPFGLLDNETQEALKKYEGGIEYFNGAYWAQVSTPSWRNSVTYRAKPVPPKPREFWINVYQNNALALYHNKKDALEFAGGAQTILVREVIEPKE